MCASVGQCLQWCAGLGDSLLQVLTAAGRGSLPSPCTELTPWGTLSMLQVTTLLGLSAALSLHCYSACQHRNLQCMLLPDQADLEHRQGFVSCYVHLLYSITECLLACPCSD